METLVTGGTGFIGRHLVAALVERGEAVRCLVRRANVELESLPVEQVAGDITDPRSLHGIAEGIGTVYHLAAAGHVAAGSDAAYEGLRRLNVLGLENLLSGVCRAGCVHKLVHFSSTAAMGLIEGRADESSTCRPLTPYQRTKRESEELVLRHHREYGLPAVIVRPSMVYGPGDRNREFLSMCRLVRRGLFPVPMKGKALTPMVYVTDVVQGAMLAAERGAPGEVYILTSESSYPLAELVRQLAKELGVRRGGLRVPGWTLTGAAVMMEAASRVTGRPPSLTRRRVRSILADRDFDITRAKTRLGFQPNVTLQEGIARTVAWLREQGLL